MTIFPFTKKNKEVTKLPKHTTVINKTEDFVCNHELTYGLYHNTMPGFKLAGALAYNPIAVPVSYMGVPSVTSKDATTQKRITDLIKDFFTQMSQIHTQCHRDGTIWVYPFYSPVDRQLHWEYIPDETVYKIVKDIDTNEIISIITKETLTVSRNDSSDNELSTTRWRVFTKNKITETYYGEALPNDIHNRSKLNVAGILPIPFANDPELGEVRGHSDYERLVTDFKAYNDEDLARSTILAEFNPKMIVNLTTSSPDDFCANNGWDTPAEIDVAKTSLIVTAGDDTIKYEYPGASATSGYSDALSNRFHKLVEGSGIPEIAWGLKTTGNSNSTEDSMSTLLNFVKNKQDQKTVLYEKLFVASLQILSIAEMTRYNTDITVEWGKLDGISMINKAQIFSNFTAGLNNIVTSASASKEMIYNMWNLFYPEENAKTIEEYIKGISETAKHHALTTAKYEDIMDLESPDKVDTDGIDMTEMPK